MSLDVHLVSEAKTVECACSECGHTHTTERRDELFWANITHNLGRMASEAGIYEIVWTPDEIGIKTAGEIVDRLAAGIELMESDPPRFEKHNAPNGWGLYVHFLPWLRRYLAACREHPAATIRVSR